MRRRLRTAILVSVLLHAAVLAAVDVAVRLGSGRADGSAAMEGLRRGELHSVRVVLSEPGAGPAAEGPSEPEPAATRAARAKAAAARAAPAETAAPGDTAAPVDAPPTAKRGGGPQAPGDSLKPRRESRVAARAGDRGATAGGREQPATGPGRRVSERNLAAGRPAPPRPPGAAPTAAAGPPAPPELASPIDPVYPFRARKLGHEGTVVLTVVISPTGSVVEVALEESSGFEELDAAARRAAEEATYRPGTATEPMPLRLRVVFKLS